ncbi:hypothetical protein TIFTF001_033116 [Ficus carica]|uniref:CCHC-type domain-containing protein n=1 Tax=Ficus carica TaxID=3494 RepID=A0AA88DYJ6_FICCA|nr:hypothetical protein TIFTF001_033116 [Ficus carica]
MEEMLGRLSTFSITEEEAKVIGIYDEGTFMSTMDKLWGAEGDLSIQEIDRDIFLFSFEKEQGRAKVYGGITGVFTCFWIRVFNLSYDGMIWEIGKRIGNGIGKFIDVVSDKNGRCPGIYMRLRAQIESLSLSGGVLRCNLGVMAQRSGRFSNTRWVPDLCFGCGRIGHGRLECVDAKVKNIKASDRLLYSPELRVDTRSLRSGKVGGSHPINFWGVKSIVGVESTVQVPSPSSVSLLDRSEEIHGTVHIARCEKGGLVFSIGGSEPVKKNVGKWKKEARLKGNNGSASSSPMKQKTVKRIWVGRCQFCWGKTLID